MSPAPSGPASSDAADDAALDPAPTGERIADPAQLLAGAVARRLRIPLTPPQAVQATSAVVWTPKRDPGGPVVVLATGAGSDLTHPVLRTIARGLARRGLPTLTFNFAYTEAGRKPPDPPARLQSAYRDVLAAVPAHLGAGRPVFAGGRSMGGRMASHLAAAGEPLAGLVLLGYPLHPAGKPERLRTDHWPNIRVPTLFVQGDRDALSDLALLSRERAKLGGPSTLHVLAGADHAYAARKRDGRSQGELLDEVVRVVADWIERTAAAGATGATVAR